jgi:hypothetical protein
LEPLSFTQHRLAVHKLREKTIPPRGIVPRLLQSLVFFIFFVLSTKSLHREFIDTSVIILHLREVTVAVTRQYRQQQHSRQQPPSLDNTAEHLCDFT